jgi:hypothetical protein
VRDDAHRLARTAVWPPPERRHRGGCRARVRDPGRSRSRGEDGLYSYKYD